MAPGVGGAGSVHRRLLHLARTAQSVRDALVEQADRPPSVAAVHDLHRTLRRLELELRVSEAVDAPPEARRAKTLRLRLHPLTRRAGAARDRQVQWKLFEALTKAKDGRPPEDWFKPVRRALRDRAKRGRSRWERSARRALDEGMGNEIDEFARNCLLPPASRSRSNRLRDMRAEVAEKAVVTATVAIMNPGVLELHRGRQALRSVRVFDRLLRSWRLPPPRPLPHGWSRLQGTLGDIHDLDLLLERLHRRGLPPAGSPWGKALATRVRRLRLRAVDSLSAPEYAGALRRWGGLAVRGRALVAGRPELEHAHAGRTERLPRRDQPSPGPVSERAENDE